MASALQIGDRVYVNTSRLGAEVDCPGSLYPTSVMDKNDRSVKVSLPNGVISGWIATKYAHRKAGIAIIQFGDYLNEFTNLDPLFKGILQNARILYGDDSSVHYWKLRSRVEVAHIFAAGMLSFADKIVLIAHGNDEGQLSIGSKVIGPMRLGRYVEQAINAPPSGWEFICAVCHSGRASFGKTLSEFRNVNCVIGPMHSAHSSEMAQFIQTYLNWHLLAGYTTTYAGKYARSSATGQGTFRMWSGGIKNSLG